MCWPNFALVKQCGCVWRHLGWFAALDLTIVVISSDAAVITHRTPATLVDFVAWRSPIEEWVVARAAPVTNSVTFVIGETAASASALGVENDQQRGARVDNIANRLHSPLSVALSLSF